jgi:hypothetical protein
VKDRTVASAPTNDRKRSTGTKNTQGTKGRPRVIKPMPTGQRSKARKDTAMKDGDRESPEKLRHLRHPHMIRTIEKLLCDIPDMFRAMTPTSQRHDSNLLPESGAVASCEGGHLATHLDGSNKGERPETCILDGYRYHM